MKSKHFPTLDRRDWSAWCGAMLLVLGLAQSTVAEETLLRWKFAAGQQLQMVFRQSLASETTCSVRMPGCHR